MMALSMERVDPDRLSGFGPDFDDHRAVYRVTDRTCALTAFIAIHDITLGPALGGCRMWTYEDETAAITDVLRLSRGMTYKNALAGLHYGGGKAVIVGDPRTGKSPDLFHAFGRAVERLKGNYITAEDVGIGPDDMAEIGRATAYARGTAATGLGDPSPYTALGVFHGILATVHHRFGATDLTGLTASVKGLGHVGMRVAAKLHMAGAKLIVSDIDRASIDKAVREFGAKATDPDEAHSADADIFVPCALGGGLNAATIPQIKARAIAGAANNQLAEPEDAIRLMDRGILYAPDYAINAGGVIAIALGKPGRRTAQITDKVEAVGATLAAIFERAGLEGQSTAQVADRLAAERLAAARARSAA
ncbi:MAG TPA: Glu/Leu/Phe/Val dehydrogenase dimerization domain-containing protein [Afifellaceae bacterium]|nr:Glu/Leu/Phe/Val dehydrogenase dimerization domain-containing protein [Afifellaceae bacterium]